MREDLLFPALKCLAFATSGVIAGFPVVIASASDSLSILTAEGWLQLALQAGSTFILAIFLLWVLPNLMRFQRELAKDMQNSIKLNNEANARVMENNNAAHTTVVANMTASFERHDAAWRDLINRRGYCPVRDGNHSTNTAPHHEPS
jgi:hypothetical protein